jgi:TRAP-type C4-dicarboxylate transport system substrate-binding protein
MNKAKYDAMPDDLKKILDDNSGAFAGAWAGRVMEEQDAPARQVAVDRKNNIVRIEGAELERWKEAAKPIVAAWIAEMDAKGKPGQAMVDDAKALIEKYSK